MHIQENGEGNNPLQEGTGNVQQDSTDNSTKEQKIAVNPNPRANENIKQAPFDKNTAGNNDAAGIGSVGTEITDGEAG